MMPNLQAPKPKTNFDFIDTIRCIAMMGIVYEHCLVVVNLSKSYEVLILIGVAQLFKFATITFFIISGFLINFKFQEYGTIQYLKNRFKNTILPWGIWLLILILLQFIYKELYNIPLEDKYNLPPYLELIAQELIFSIFYTSFWFIPNFFICIIILLFFKRYIYKIWFGIALTILSLIYSINIYYMWFIPDHTTALLGYVSYLWLGVMINRYFSEINQIIKKTSFLIIISIIIILFCLSVRESFFIYQLGKTDYLNTLRISNILYSISIFALLLKIGKIQWLIKYIEPKSTTYGIYLTHWMIALFVPPFIFFKLLGIEHSVLEPNNLTVLEKIILSGLRWLIAYSISFMLVKIISRTKLKWSIGVKTH